MENTTTSDNNVLTSTLWYDDQHNINEQAHKAELIVRHEWQQFQQVNNEGGRANCQGNWPTFHQMRISQFLTWRLDLLDSYAQDLDDADESGRNLLTEKYARMMESTEPERYHAELEPSLPVLDPERVAAQEAVIKQQVAWARDFRERYPKLGQAMRVLTTDEDAIGTTSFETYLRGELGTYSDRTFHKYALMVIDLRNAGVNLTEQTIATTVILGGFDGLEEAEAAQ
ncbi:DUF4125 family protein [Bifidobacterium tissieri]|uniref:DUF4125 family protein n=1 Tax=Bifidobacterium tissieri TaxID=1630162 RepID=A0A5M9ZW88_9BIFI|nr:DUF4125 family protein [Bifidobacterium tissieri]KAA8831876.1 DUF4125 family protein [Bifidobacterium tissieri]